MQNPGSWDGDSDNLQSFMGWVTLDVTEPWWLTRPCVASPFPIIGFQLAVCKGWGNQWALLHRAAWGYPLPGGWDITSPLQGVNQNSSLKTPRGE